MEQSTTEAKFKTEQQAAQELTILKLLITMSSLLVLEFYLSFGGSYEADKIVRRRFNFYFVN